MKKLAIRTLMAASLFSAAPAQALNPSSPLSTTMGALELPSGSTSRVNRVVGWDRVPANRGRAWSSFTGKHGADWRSLWDQHTGIPNRIFGRGIPAPGTIASAAAAETHARAVLAAHIDLLAPGASSSDFRLVSNEAHRGLRSVGFEQTYQGMPVIGGQVSFQYKNDRLFVISSQAFPNINVRVGMAAQKAQHAATVAKAWLLQDAAVTATTRPGIEGPLVLPIITGGRLSYRTVVKVDADTRQPIGQWSVYLDAFTGHAVARQNNLRFGSGTVLYNVPIRRADSDYANYPAPNLDISIGGSGSATSDSDGIVTWAGESSIEVTLGVSGPLVGVSNEVGTPATRTFTLANGGQVVWSDSEDELVDAQLTAYIHAHIVKEYSRTLAPSLSWLDEKIPVNVNIDDKCNAFSDGNSINFFQSSADCQNTGRLPDVVYHEFGHSLHAQSIINGVGGFDGALSEGVSDYLAATITGDSGMGRGFFYGSDPLREIDPSGKEHRWPDDVGEIHYTGLIIAGALWDLRKAYIDLYGEEEGIAMTDRAFYAVLQSASDIPSAYVAVIADDDDDGDLSNGTPNICTINAQFGAHGLRALQANVTGLASQFPNAEGHPVTLTLRGLFESCPGDVVESASVSFHRTGRPEEVEDLELTNEGEGVFAGVVPDPGTTGVVEYWIEIEFADNSVRRFPENPADERYQFYVGELIELYCTSFDTDPFEEGWTHGLSSGEESEGADDWQWGPPLGSSGSGDPTEAFTGENVIGNDLGGQDFNGQYQANKTNFARMPAIDTNRYSDVRLQYWRWLTVEDAYFDKATIYVDEFRAWQNLDSDQGNSSAVHHRDREWRFHDVALSPFIVEDSFVTTFEISSDAGLEFGGWTIDDLCIVADANSLCGDGKLTGSEMCDDGAGNSDTLADACRGNCRAASCGDGVRDTLEQCDDGNRNNDDGCSSSCQREHGADCGLSVTGRGSAGSGGLVLFAVFLVGYVWRRRR